MPILQNELVMKSIEALHDEALTLMPDTDAQRDSAEATPPTVLRAASTSHELSVATPTTTNDDHDIMTRIDNLLKQIDEDDVAATTPPASNKSFAKTKHMSDHADNATAGHPIITDSGPLSVESDMTNPNDLQDSATNSTTDNAAAVNIAFGQSIAKAPSDQDQTLSDIAAAIYQAREQASETVATDAGRKTDKTFDIDELSANVANEVRRTVSAMMNTELPQMVRSAVSEVMLASLADASHQTKSTTVKSKPAKSGAKQKTIPRKKLPKKKATSKETVGKKAAAKKTTLKKHGKS